MLYVLTPSPHLHHPLQKTSLTLSITGDCNSCNTCCDSFWDTILDCRYPHALHTISDPPLISRTSEAYADLLSFSVHNELLQSQRRATRWWNQSCRRVSWCTFWNGELRPASRLDCATTELSSDDAADELRLVCCQPFAQCVFGGFTEVCVYMDSCYTVFGSFLC